MFSQITIVGAGRIGTLFATLSTVEPLIEVALLKRGDIELLPSGPIVICTRNDDLDGVLEWVPKERYADLIFIQNGMLQSWFDERQLSTITQGLLYIAVSKVGEAPVDGLRSVVTGPQADVLVWLLMRLGLQCKVVEQSVFFVEMLEKLLWNCVFGLLCDVFEKPVGQVVEQHHAAVSRLTFELLDVAMPVLGLNSSQVNNEGLLERLCTYSMSIPLYRGSLKEWDWRNGWFWNRQENEADTSIHGKYLKAVQSI
jgi:ketopantoate reductase